MWGEDWGTMIWSGFAQVPAIGLIGWSFLVGGIAGASAVLYRKPLSKAGTTLAVLLIALGPLVALAQVVLPNTFANGTVADADEVNANFEAIHAETARYHLTLVGAPGETFVAVPHAVTQQLCEDEDGCEIHVAFLEVGNGAMPVSSTPARMSFDLRFGRVAWGSSAGSQGLDDSGGAGGMALAVVACEFSDGDTFANGLLEDTGLGFSFYARSNTSAVECRLTISD